MKKVILVLASFAITAISYAQTDSTTKKMTPPDLKSTEENIDKNYDRNHHSSQKIKSYEYDGTHPDGVMKINGKMKLVKNGQITDLNQQITMKNGSVIKSDGTCVRKDGTKVTIQEGQHMDMYGELIPMNADKDRNIQMKPDSTHQPE